ncbi:MAG TPA: metallophosphoesterase family protein [Thermoanaerobaculia bacterium]
MKDEDEEGWQRFIPHPSSFRIGVIADTHGLLRPEVIAAFAHVDHILHAGDIGGEDVIASLGAIAPVTFVNGNNDGSDGYEIARKSIGGCRVLLTHILPRPRDPAPAVAASLQRSSADVVVFGHSHLPHDERVDGVWFFNPASAGPRRFDYPVSIGMIEKTRDGWRGQHIALDGRSVAALRQRMNQLSRR